MGPPNIQTDLAPASHGRRVETRLLRKRVCTNGQPNILTGLLRAFPYRTAAAAFDSPCESPSFSIRITGWPTRPAPGADAPVHSATEDFAPDAPDLQTRRGVPLGLPVLHANIPTTTLSIILTLV